MTEFRMNVTSVCKKLTFFANEGQGPREDVHEVRQPVRMRRAVELPDVHHVVFVLEDSRWKMKEIFLERLRKKTNE